MLPAYDYRCESCGKTFEVRHHMTENPPVVCSRCGNPARRVILTFSHVAFDWKAYDKRETQRRLSLHAAHAGRPSPTSEQAGRRT